MTALIFHERIGLERRRISPFSWRIRYAFAHKGLTPEVVETRFADVDRIRRLSGQHMVPIIEHDGTVVHDSWSIACHLEDRFPDAPPLFGGGIGRGVTRMANLWADTVLSPALRIQILPDFPGVLMPEDRAYYRSSREAELGMTLEEAASGRDAALPALAALCRPLQLTLSEQPFLSGTAPAYADYIVFSLFQYARIGSPRDMLALMPELPAVLDWRTRMIGLFDGMGDRFGLHPRN
ncbi:MAG TPA: glutathione S-transferase N-terminal domain-containing protein [Rhodopila sp.]|uniref:glutathione S-transferase N-terminal domain-containing protein n=1 Tax=Rhodopila sp. TaxID=2480087 RepID=UPI002C8F1569|nr:glutathione S-transferase N-terminal domain-containing protein [Rhodopila sp.]HVY17455.1 glutathione S-transferase N-terminal domain-containing protein [Rhodopila sp.]